MNERKRDQEERDKRRWTEPAGFFRGARIGGAKSKTRQQKERRG